MTSGQPGVLALSELVLGQLSPAEVPLVQAVGPRLLSARRRWWQRRPRDGALGIGVDEFAWTVAVLPVANHVVTWLFDQAKEFAGEELGKGARRALDWLSGRDAGAAADHAESAPHLPVRQAIELWWVTYRNGLAVGLDEQKARLLANATAGPFGAPADPADPG
ncbi:hypothetical protein BJY16_004609 [Actinoplanes octamycinicus]|uniref:Uncharacterized protein n=1 Tax=Actinoplanes octamycinicus TaxID=135948 RepID=A0A7W7M8T5_9ACTN|nr:hypothetical protein [Actinoplanes octamycinicus]MBB4741150.1 hypothetical protein [Actinoplanes octamycinicus]GIE56057.1 hypothetical protein Aoc01nite_14590 [Actinoplanes octamycinicus]